MSHSIRHPIALAALLVLAGCGGGGGSDATPAIVSVPTPTNTTTTTDSGLTAVQQAALLRRTYADSVVLQKAGIEFRRATDDNSLLLTQAQACPGGGSFRLLLNGAAVSPGASLDLASGTFDYSASHCVDSAGTDINGSHHAVATSGSESSGRVESRFNDYSAKPMGSTEVTVWNGASAMDGAQSGPANAPETVLTTTPGAGLSSASLTGGVLSYTGGSVKWTQRVGNTSAEEQQELQSLRFAVDGREYVATGGYTRGTVPTAGLHGAIEVRTVAGALVGHVRFNGAGANAITIEPASGEVAPL